MVEHRNWSELVPDLLNMISEKIDSVQDLISFGCVCGSWKSVTLDNKHKYALFTNSPQWLMLCENDFDDRRSFFSITENKVFHVELPEASGLRCWGSPFGWLVTLGKDRSMSLLNPLSRSKVPLPSARTLEDPKYSCTYEGRPQKTRQYVRKAMIVNTPSSSSQSSLSDVENFMVFVIYGICNQLAFARPGDASWTCDHESCRLAELLHLDGKLYTVDLNGKVCIYDISGPNPIVKLFSQPPTDEVTVCSSFYLVELYGHLHMAARSMNYEKDVPPIEYQHPFSTDFFVVYKFDTTTSKWEEVETLGGYAIFVGGNTSFAVLASDYPRCKPDCIYYTDAPYNLGYLTGNDTGIYHVQTEEIHPLHVGEYMFSRYSPPVWFRPKLL